MRQPVHGKRFFCCVCEATVDVWAAEPGTIPRHADVPAGWKRGLWRWFCPAHVSDWEAYHEAMKEWNRRRNAEGARHYQPARAAVSQWEKDNPPPRGPWEATPDDTEGTDGDR